MAACGYAEICIFQERLELVLQVQFHRLALLQIALEVACPNHPLVMMMVVLAKVLIVHLFI